MLRLDNVTYQYSGASLSGITRLSLNVRPGDRLAVMGANGSGKTTLARLIAGLLTPQSGRIDLPDTTAPVPVGMVFQSPDNQIIALTVEKEIAFALENLGVSQAEMSKHITAVLDAFNIAPLRKRLTAELSGGEKQRVAIAGVMVLEPAVLILDEPETFQDVAGRRALLEILDDLTRRRPDTIIIHITQEQQIAEHYDRLLVLDDGKLAADSAPKTLFSDTDLCRRLRIIGGPEAGRAADHPEDSRRTHKRVIEQVDGDAVAFGYDPQQPILESLDLDLRSGSVTAVVGPSGSGKSTLALLLARLHKPTAGRLTFRDISGNLAPSATLRGRTVAVFQQPERQFFLNSCTEEIEFGPRNLGRSITHYQVERLLDQVGLQPEIFFNRDPFSLSGGEKRRLAFAVALALSPDLIIFDEPTCALDADGISRFLRLVRLLKDRGSIVVIITHNGALLRRVAEKVIILESGRPPRHRATDSFLAASDVENFVTTLY